MKKVKGFNEMQRGFVIKMCVFVTVLVALVIVLSLAHFSTEDIFGKYNMFESVKSS